MAGHQVIAFANGLSAKLAARSRHVCAFVGAGAARACGLPDVAGLQNQVLDGLEGDQRAAFEALLAKGNLEEALSRLRRIAVLLHGTEDRVDGLTADEAHALDGEVCRLIVAALDVSSANPAPMLRFAAWVARADYHLPLEIFTVNYHLERRPDDRELCPSGVGGREKHEGADGEETDRRRSTEHPGSPPHVMSVLGDRGVSDDVP